VRHAYAEERHRVHAASSDGEHNGGIELKP